MRKSCSVGPKQNTESTLNKKEYFMSLFLLKYCKNYISSFFPRKEQLMQNVHVTCFGQKGLLNNLPLINLYEYVSSI